MKLVVIFVALVVVFLLCWLLWIRQHQSGEESPPMYVIHLNRATKRMKNIETQTANMSHGVQVFPAVDGKKLNLSSVPSDYNVVNTFKSGSMGEVACYLSHLELLRYIHKNNSSQKYAVVFEDDFAVDPSFVGKMRQVLRTLEADKVSFDMLYLGNLTNYHGASVKSRVKVTRMTSTINQACWGTHGYVLNTKSIAKIVNCIRNINESIDGAFQTHANRGDIIALVLSDNLVTQQGDDESYIRSVPFHIHSPLSNKNPPESVEEY
jgi:GR25 family glycosyltransferase involved in LPS biosynthesis